MRKNGRFHERTQNWRHSKWSKFRGGVFYGLFGVIAALAVTTGPAFAHGDSIQADPELLTGWLTWVHLLLQWVHLVAFALWLGLTAGVLLLDVRLSLNELLHSFWILFLRSKSSLDNKMRILWLFSMIVVVSSGIGGQHVTADSPADSQVDTSERAPVLAAVEVQSQSPAKRGSYLYETHCKACHGDRNGNGRTAGASPHNEKGHSWHHPDTQLIDWVLNGKFRAEAMPRFKSTLTEEDVRSILRFIKGWWTPEQRKIQQDVSRRYQEALDRDRKTKR
jgi:S-disulfanyl-L-cysteine oxidoreductase SoxD